MFKVFDDQFIEFDEPTKDLIELTKEFQNDISKLIKFFKKRELQENNSIIFCKRYLFKV